MEASVKVSSKHGIKVALTLLIAGLAPSAKADFVSSTLGTAGPSNYAILATGTNVTVGLNVPNVTGIVGNVGLATGGDLAANNTNATSPGNEVNGNVYFQGASNFGGSGGCASIPTCLVTGGIFTMQSQIGTAITDANSASLTFAALAATSGVTSITGNMTINATGSVTVVDLTNFNLGNATKLTLNGSAGDQFIVNVPASDWNTLQGQVVETGGVSANDVVINVTGAGNLHFSGGGNAAGIDGILLAESADISMSPGFINGELIAGGTSIQIVSGGEVHNVPTVPEPRYTSFIVVGLLAAIALMQKKRLLLRPNVRHS
jgi:choice-of-anchor A domain-containing protein